MESYGPPEAGVTVVQTYGYVEIEYAAIRKGVALFDWPLRGTIEVTGADRLAFLNRMLTQELKGAQAFSSHRAFWLNRKGRIDADVRVLILPEKILLDVDIHAAERTVSTLSSYAIMDEVVMTDVSAGQHRMAAHGPAAARLLAEASTPIAGPAVLDIAPGQVCQVQVAGHLVVVERFDSAGEIGLELTVASDQAQAVYSALLMHGHEHRSALKAAGHTAGHVNLAGAKPAGWAAYNIARLEAGTPLYYLDFGPDSLPAETGVLNDRVSFTKGCYLGQEIVARMHSLGSPKRKLVAVEINPGDAGASAGGGDYREDGLPRQPATGSAVYPAGTTPDTAPQTEPIGAVTSATIGPMAGNRPICFAMMKFSSTPAGTAVVVECEGSLVAGRVRPELAFVSRR